MKKLYEVTTTTRVVVSAETAEEASLLSPPATSREAVQPNGANQVEAREIVSAAQVPPGWLDRSPINSESRTTCRELLAANDS